MISGRYTDMCEFHHTTRSIVQLTYTYVFLLAFTMMIAVEATGTAPTILHSNSDSREKFTAKIGSNGFVADHSKQSHSRRKRLVWITDDGRLALPPGTALTNTPRISMPLVRHPREGFFSKVSSSFTLTSEYSQILQMKSCRET